MSLTPKELMRVREYLKITAAHLRQLIDRGPLMSDTLCDRLLGFAQDAEDLRRKLGPSKG